MLMSRQIIDLPNSRSSHTQPKPRGGGLVIVTFTLIGVWMIYPTMTASIDWWKLLFYTLGALFVAGVSWLDDILSLPSWLRLAIHSLGALAVIYSLGYVQVITLPLMGQIHLGWVGLPQCLQFYGWYRRTRWFSGCHRWDRLGPAGLVGGTTFYWYLGAACGRQQRRFLMAQLATCLYLYGRCRQCFLGLYICRIAAFL